LKDSSVKVYQLRTWINRSKIRRKWDPGYAWKFCRRPGSSEVIASEQSLCSASNERAVLVYIRCVQIPYKKRSRNVGRDDLLLKCNIGCEKHTADRALIALRGLIALLQERFMSKWWYLSKVEAWNFTIKTFETSQFNETRLFICRNAVVQEKAPETCRFHGRCFKNKEH